MGPLLSTAGPDLDISGTLSRHKVYVYFLLEELLAINFYRSFFYLKGSFSIYNAF
jgi:hypothetical protein